MASSNCDPMLPQRYRVVRVQREMPDTFTLELAPVDAGPLCAYAGGQFNMLYVFGIGEIPISISGGSAGGETFMHTTRAVGPVSKGLCELSVGDMLGVRGPFGSHWPLEQVEGKDVVIAAGGLGLAPLRTTIYSILAQRERYKRLILFYGARTPDDILYRRELARWSKQVDLEILITVDQATPPWRGSVGVVTRLVPQASLDPLNTVAFLCGPEVMMRFTILELMKRGLAAEQIYISMERNMKCAIGLCGRCQYGPEFVCKDGPIVQYSRVQALFTKREI